MQLYRRDHPLLDCQSFTAAALTLPIDLHTLLLQEILKIS